MASARALGASLHRLHALAASAAPRRTLAVSSRVHLACRGVAPVAARAFHQSARAQKIVTFNLADIGEAIAEVELVEWKVKVGDKVAQFDQLCVVESDKATVPISSRYAGTVVKLYHEAGQMAATGKPLVDIETDDAAAAAAVSGASAAVAPAAAAASCTKSAPVAAAAAAAPAVTLTASGGKILMTPAVRAMLHREKIDPSRVPATGKGGRLLKDDLFRFLENPTPTPAPTAAAAPGSSSSSATTVAAAAAAAAPPAVIAFPAGVDRVEPVTGVRRAMAKAMTQSMKIPHFGYCDEIVLNRLMATRELLKPIALERGIKLSFMPFMLKAASLALLQYPVLNSHVLDDECSAITYKGDHNIGVAMATAQGLMVPNIKQVQQKSIFDIAADLNALQKRGSERALTTTDLTGGTFTLSNIGTVGGTYTSPVITAPQVAIGATGATQKVPRFDANDNVYAAHIMQVSWSADHRVIDGVTIAKFSNLWKQYLENPETMLLDLK